VAADIHGVSGRAMMEALIAGERDPQALAALAKGRMRVKRAALLEALTGRFDEHHAELLRILLDQVDALTEKIEVLSAHIEKLIGAIPAAQAPPIAPPARDALGDDQGPLPAVERLDEITGIGRSAAQTIIAEVGLNMAQFATAGQPGVVGQAVSPHHPVRCQEPIGQDRLWQPLPQGRPGRGGSSGGPDRHLLG
jgi:transposase